MEMADRIKEKRLAMGYTQEELAEKLGLQKSAIAKYENGRVENIKRTVISNMAKILECSPAYLMGWIDDKDSEGLLDYFDNTLDEIILYLKKNGYTVLQTDSQFDDTIIIKNRNQQIIKTTTKSDLVSQYEKVKIENLPKNVENLLNIAPIDILPEHIRAAARGMTDLSPEDQKTAIDMINFLAKKGREAKDN